MSGAHNHKTEHAFTFFQCNKHKRFSKNKHRHQTP